MEPIHGDAQEFIYVGAKKWLLAALLAISLCSIAYAEDLPKYEGVYLDVDGQWVKVSPIRAPKTTYEIDQCGGAGETFYTFGSNLRTAVQKLATEVA